MKKRSAISNQQSGHCFAGFTLLEILISVAIIAVIGTIASASLFSLLKGASKSDVLREVKQNGDYALSVMEIKIRNARSVVSTCALSPGTTAESIQILNQDNTSTTFGCSGGRITERVGALTNYLTNTTVAVANNCTNNISFACTTAPDGKSKSLVITYTLTQTNANVPTFEQASQTFETRISLRNK